ncbi:MAG: BatA domain-containing protein [Chitinispirillaceae bacterium]
MNAFSFFQPMYLWAALFLAVVLFIHLFRQQRVKRLDISTLRFFSSAAKSVSRAKNFRRFLLLLTRLLLVTTLVLIFAGLYNKDNPLVKLHDPESSVYTWIDPTISMEYVENGTALKECAHSVLDSFITSLPPSVKHLNYDQSDGRFVRVDRGEEIKVNTRYGPVGLERAVEAFLYGETDEKSSLVLISDFQKSTTDLIDSLTEKILPVGKAVICVSVSPYKPWNYSLKAAGRPGNGNGITAEVSAWGKKLDSVGVSAHFSSLKAGQAQVVVEKGDSVQVSVGVPAEVSGSGKLKLAKRDPLMFDNSDYFPSQSDRSQSVLIVGDRERNGVVAAAFSVASESWNPVVQKEGEELTYDHLNDADLIVVNGYTGYSRMLESFVNGSAAAEKGMILCIDPEAEHDFVTALLRKNKSVRNFSVLENEDGVHPVLTDIHSELWKGFPRAKSRNARVYRYAAIRSGNVLIGLDNRGVLASQMGTGSGEWVVCTTPLGVTSANNLCETGFYLPLIDRLAQQAIIRDRDLKDVWYAGYPKPNPFYGKDRTAVLYDENDKIVSNWSTQPYVTIDKPGIYQLVPAGGEPYEIAVSFHPSECRIEYSRPVENESESIYYFKSGQFLRQIRDLANNIWSYLLWMILAFLTCVETFLWNTGRNRNFKSRPKR